MCQYLSEIFFLLQYNEIPLEKSIIEIEKNIKILNDSKKIYYLNIRKNIVHYLQKLCYISNHELHYLILLIRINDSKIYDYCLTC